MPDPLAAKKLLREFGVRPRKDLGQNFIVDKRALDKVLAAADLDAEQVVLEVGAGLGALTRELASVASKVVAVELDQRLLPILDAVLNGFRNVHIIGGDVLAVQLDLPARYDIVANIPYSITSALIRHFLETESPPSKMVITVQSEVAERAIAEPGHMSLLSLSIQIYGVPEIRGRIEAASFYPQPEVDSAVLGIDMHPEPKIAVPHLGPLFRLAKTGFSQRRKMLRNSLAPMLGKDASEILERAGIDPTSRAQELSVADWEALVRTADLA